MAWGLSEYNQQAYVTGIDIDSSVKPYFELQNSLNRECTKFQERNFESFSQSELEQYNYIMSSDICFWDEMTDPLYDFIQRSIEIELKRNIYFGSR